MSNNILPKIFEGFPELANQAESLDVALDILSQRIEAHLADDASQNASSQITDLQEKLEQSENAQNQLRAQVTALEASQAEQEKVVPTGFAAPAGETALKNEVSHWKEKYDALASRFDEEIEAAKTPPIDESVLQEKDAQIATLTQSKDQAGSEIARLAEALALAKKDGDLAKAQLDSVNAQLEEVQSDLGGETDGVGVPGLEAEISDLKAAAAAAQDKIQALESECRAAEERANASEAARANASARLGSLIASLNAVHSAGAA